MARTGSPSSALIEGSPCGECAELSAHVDHLSQTARDPKPHTNYKYLGLANMQDIVQSYADQARQLRLQGLNASREYISALTRLDDYHRLLMAISEYDIPCLQQIINVALDNAGHRLFVKKPLSLESLLYGILINMPGLNMWTGDDDVTLDIDPKHIFKCVCTLIRSPSGITLNNRWIINAMMLSCYLVWLPAYDKASVTKLLHPDDLQDVPRAVELIKAIIKFTESQHDFLDDLFSPNIDRHADLMSIALLSDVIESFLIPFINVNLSLTEQVQYLS
ncbi:uncharacterized protein F5891DRAFT_1195401 [Suillus fuscotomentosus]|uniref:Uncharacterized protein n=1 Tax=Suillus fuscotomentosus TaxID=1912939 RepID=A0AAD4DUW2_9AGAM|nr:uncharacterized protein F5891DRAFT_1195401 [Suillus fuscotomentosus]KAG1894264.1 hypothetical protein F5891DRAFT_1195401 [Suillus fuscotomentosus]